MRVVVVGSGASGVHFAWTLLEQGHRVTMLDVGRHGAAPPLPDATFHALKDRLDDPVAYFLGADCRNAILPDYDAELYGIPPGKDYVLEPLPGFRYDTRGFSPLFSFAAGGLAQAWTAGCYPMNDDELADFPFGYADLEPHYVEVARRIGVTGERDDLARFMPYHDGLLEPLRFDEHSARLVAAYEKKKDAFHRKLGCYLGRTRVATLSRDLDDRKACSYLGRCLWGCPDRSLYTPSDTLRRCRQHPDFRYVPGVEVTHLECAPDGVVKHAVARRIEDGDEQTFEAERFGLAAGTLVSTRIFLRTIERTAGNAPELPGLMDNRQVLVPFVNLGMIGRPYRADTYQYHLLGMGLESPDPRDYVHCQMTALKTTLMHPIVQKLPFDLATSTAVARITHAALGLVNVNFRDTRRPDNRVALTDGRLALRYAPEEDEPQRLSAALRRVRAALRKLGCIVPPGMQHLRPMGASVHYAGTVPMTEEPAPWTTDRQCRSRDLPNLYLVDGATYPFLPAKNVTFTLMANAVRAAREGFG